MTLWIFFALMSIAAIGFAIWPLYRRQRKLSPLIASAIVLVVALSSGLYFYQGKPNLPSGAGSLPDIEEMVTTLATRLESNPEDLNGWKMLGRSYMTIGNYSAAVTAFENAMQLESAQDSQTLVSLGEALLASTGGTIEGRISSMFENALALDPNNPQALFYGGIGAFNRTDKSLAADRWERLLALNPPAEIQGILQQRIAEWRGEAPPQSTPPPAATSSASVVVSASISLTSDAAESLPLDATVFVIARDPAQPSPPIAVTRRRLSEFPATVDLGDRESMIPGRTLSGFDEFELIARVSVSGQPIEQPGDWFGTQIVRPGENNNIELSINQQVR